MRIRIPGPVNRVLDAVERRQWVASTAVVACAVAILAVALAVGHLTAGFAAVMVAALLFVAVRDRARESRLREQVRQRDYDLAAERAENARLRAGDPTAPTAQLRPIGDRGELT